MTLRLMPLLALILATLAAPVAAQQATDAPATTPFRPAAVVNDDVITAFDVVQRAQLLQTLGARAPSADVLRRQALDALVEDKLKLQAGRRAGVKPTTEMITAGITELSERAKVTPTELKAALNAQGISDQALVDYAAASMVWREVVRARFNRRIEPSPGEIDEQIEMVQKRGATAYRLREIGLAYRGRGEEQTRALAERLYAELSAGGDFARAARRHSQSPSRSNGGLVGWLAIDALPPQIGEAVARLSPGQVTRPIPVQGGVTMYQLVDTRSELPQGIDPKDPQLREQVRNYLLNEEINRLADGLLQELRRDAMIEIR